MTCTSKAIKAFRVAQLTPLFSFPRNPKTSLCCLFALAPLHGSLCFQDLPPSNFAVRSIHTTTLTAMSGGSLWDEKYSEEEFAYGTEPNDFLKETIANLKLPSSSSGNNKCLLLADGEGRNGVFMAEQGFDVVSVDYSAKGLEKAQKLAQSRGVKIETVLADLADFNLGTEQWDCIVGIFCHFPPPVRAKVLQGLTESLKKGGYFILECYTPDQVKYGTGGPPVPDPCYTKQMLQDALGNHLEVTRNEELERDVVEGTLHTGKAAVVQFIGKK